MGISRLTAMMIQSNDPGAVKVHTFRDRADKWGMAVWLYHGEEPHTSLISTGAVFADEASAKQYGDDLVADIRKMDLA